ncbi:PDZ domain-containing protein [Candidatus Dependentiae bacterium]|nr:PDZ domain-containing protein [Candidatus Dependentiae bacterium]
MTRKKMSIILIPFLCAGISATHDDKLVQPAHKKLQVESDKEAKAEQQVAARKRGSKAVKKTTKSVARFDAERDIFQWFQTYSEVVSLVENKAFRTVDFGQFIQDSLKAAVSQVDAHSAFFSRESYKSALESTSGEFSGIGVSIISKTPEDEALAIIDVIQQGPAERAGLRAGDKIVEVDGEKLRGLATDEVVAKLKGRIGTRVQLKIIRDKRPMSFKVMRKLIKDQTSLCYLFKQQGVYYLSLKIFNEMSGKQISELLKTANEGRCRGIVLDLRRNPGGTLDAAIEVAELFLDKGSKVVMTRDRDRKLVAEYKTAKEPLLKSDVPIFILIDNFTASAAEILAGCLKYHSEKTAGKRKLMVFLLGIPTFGKGSVQELIPIKNGCALKLTSMLYFLPGDTSIQAEGIQPDFLVKPKMVPADEMRWVQELYGKESSLKNFITKEEVAGEKQEKKKKNGGGSSFWSRLFSSGDIEEPENNDVAEQKADDKDASEDKKSWDQRQVEALMSDQQVQTCINMISFLHLARKANPTEITTRSKALKFLKDHFVTDDPTVIEKIK